MALLHHCSHLLLEEVARTRNRFWHSLASISETLNSIVVFGTYTHLTLTMLLLLLQLELRKRTWASWLVASPGPDWVVFAVALVAVMVLLPYVILAVYA